MFSASNSVRLFFLNASIIMMVGIWLSGFDKVHWFIYFLPVFLTIAAITGFCPGLMISKRILNMLGIKE